MSDTTWLMRPSVVDVAVTRVTSRIPRTLRLWLEGFLVSALGAFLAYATMRPLRDRGQTFYNDVTTQALGPDRHGLANLLRHGVWPSWLPNAYGGEPYLANSQHGVLYPGNLPFLIFHNTSTALDVMIWGHVVLGFLGAWWVVRVCWGRGFWAGTTAAVMFGLGSQVLTHTILGDQLQGTVLAPWVIGATHLALERGKLRHVLLLSVMTGLQFLAGHPEMWLYTLGMSVTYGIAWILQSTDDLWGRAWRAALRVGGGIALFALLFAWQLLPTLQLQKQGYRQQGLHQQYPLPTNVGVDSLLPDYGHVLVGENEAFVGVLGLVLFFLALAVMRRRLLWLRIWLLAMAMLGFVMALGNSNAFYKFFYDNGPLIHSFRVPSRWLLLTNLAFALGAGLGVDELLRGGKGATLALRVRERILGLGFAGLAALAGTGFAFLLASSSADGKSWHKWLAALAGGVIAWVACSVPAVPRIAVALCLVATASYELRGARPGAEYRQVVPNVVYNDYGTNLATISANKGRYMSVVSSGGQSPATDAQRATTPIPPGLSGLEAAYYRVAVPNHYFGVPNSQLGGDADTILGRDGGLLPTGRWKDFYTATTGASGDIGGGRQLSPPSKLNWAAMDLLGIDWFLIGDGQQQVEYDTLAQHGFVQVGSDAYVQRWHRTTTTPSTRPAGPDNGDDKAFLATTLGRARLIHSVDLQTDEDKRTAMLSAGYDVLGRAIVEKPVSVDPAQPGESVSMGPEGRTTVQLTATVRSTALLVLADPIYPGWEVTVDGKKADILAVDSALRGVVLKPGYHQVEFRFVDKKFRLGLGLSALTIIGLVSSTVALNARRRQSETEASPVVATTA